MNKKLARRFALPDAGLAGDADGRTNTWRLAAIAVLISWWIFFGGLNVSVAIQNPSSNSTVVVGPNLRASANLTEGTRNECWIAASLTSPRFLVGVAQTAPSEEVRGMGGRACAAMISRNGGQTWREIVLPKAGAGDFDPMAVAGPEGQMYVMYGFIGRPPGTDTDPMSSLGRRQAGVIRVWATTDE
ncbi:MAG: hypothetical protein IMZ61_09270, partial [Planctomycetes bacterium]|nr:hypothetical protein [Planctomycetota bacterium]